MKTQVMKTAWAIAREGAAKFGGRAVDYIGEALRLAWAALVNEVQSFLEKLQALGCISVRVWEKAGHSRVYVDGFHASKSFYVNQITGEVVPNRPGAQADAVEILENAGVEIRRVKATVFVAI